jgi:hypothetical protein
LGINIAIAEAGGGKDPPAVEGSAEEAPLAPPENDMARPYEVETGGIKQIVGPVLAALAEIAAIAETDQVRRAPKSSSHP